MASSSSVRCLIKMRFNSELNVNLSLLEKNVQSLKGILDNNEIIYYEQDKVNQYNSKMYIIIKGKVNLIKTYSELNKRDNTYIEEEREELLTTLNEV